MIDIIVVVTLVLVCLANATLVFVLVRRLLPGQPVPASSSGQPVTPIAAAPVTVADLPARPRTAEEQAEYEAAALNRIVAKLVKDYPNMGASKREVVAREILTKARGLLARAP